jgi:hypothetical protein
MQQVAEDFIPFNDIIRKNLQQTRKWGMFLAIMGFIFSGFSLLAGLFMMLIGAALPLSRIPGISSSAFGLGVGVFYLFIAAFYFFPSLWMFRFCTKVKAAFELNDEFVMGEAFENLNRLIKFIGIMIIVGIASYSLFVLILIIAAFAQKLH